MGRPSKYSEAIAREICVHLATGKSLRSYCRQQSKPAISTVMRWLFDPESEKTGFREQYERARCAQAEIIADEIIDISDDGENDYMRVLAENGECEGFRQNGEFVSRSKLRIDARKWCASKMYIRRYGDKQQHEHSGPNGGPIESRQTVDASGLTDEQIRALAAIPVHDS